MSHGDVIKAILADALGTHLDQFQRIVVDPASVSVINYTATRPFVMRVNDTGAPLDGFRPKKRRRGRRASSDAVVGGGAGEGSLMFEVFEYRYPERFVAGTVGTAGSAHVLPAGA